jgi:L-iditol 2-dehydrogenase
MALETVPGKMKAAVLYGPKDLRFETVDTPVPAEDEVLIQVLANGLCGSDIHFYDEGRLGPFRVTTPYIPGHESVGRVVVSNRSGPKREAGEIVAIEPGIPCRCCEHCRSGRYNLCPDVVFLSAPPVNGTFAQFVAVAADFAHPVPAGLPHEEAALVEPVSVGIQACKRGGLSAGQTCAIVGAGPIGLITLMVARAYGATEIYLADVQPNRLRKAEEMGATAVINAKERDVPAAVMELTGGRGVDVVFDTSGSTRGNALTPFLAKRGGTVTVVGWPESPRVDFPMEEVIERELDIRGVNRYCNTYPPALALMARGSINTAPLISHRFAFEDVCSAFRFASENRSETIKVVISNPGDQLPA